VDVILLPTRILHYGAVFVFSLSLHLSCHVLREKDDLVRGCDHEKIGLVLLMLVATKDLGFISFLLFLPLVVVTLNGTGIEAFGSKF
jgi:hypothetical protein